MPDDVVIPVEPTIESQVTDLIGEGPEPTPPAEPSVADVVAPAILGEPVVPVVPAAPVYPTEVDLDGRKVPWDTLLNRARQTEHLQQLQATAKPFIETMQRWGVCADQLPVLEQMIVRMLSPAPGAPATAPVVDEMTALKEKFKNFSEFYPEEANALLQFVVETRKSAKGLDELKQQIGGLMRGMQGRDEQESAAHELTSLSNRIEALSGTYHDLKQQEHRAGFVQFLAVKNPPMEMLKDEKVLEGLYMVFNRDGIAKTVATQAEEAKVKQAATRAGAFAEGGAARSTPQTMSQIEKEVHDLITN